MWVCEFYSPSLHCLNEYLHLWNMESLVLMAGFYCLPMATHPLIPIRYSLPMLGIECILWLRPSLMSVHYVLHWIAFNSSIERWMILTLIDNKCEGDINFNSFFPVGLSVTLLPIWHVNRYSCHLWRIHLMYDVVIHHIDDASLMEMLFFSSFAIQWTRVIFLLFTNDTW